VTLLGGRGLRVTERCSAVSAKDVLIVRFKSIDPRTSGLVEMNEISSIPIELVIAFVVVTVCAAILYYIK
jgi:hypothetical protein